eukprot:5591481-Pleurochrysis_carterae.AAC.2
MFAKELQKHFSSSKDHERVARDSVRIRSSSQDPLAAYNFAADLPQCHGIQKALMFRTTPVDHSSSPIFS